MHNVLIIEDDHLQCELLKDTICNCYPTWIVQVASNYADAKVLITDSVKERNLYTLFLFDIQLSKEEGDRGGFFLAKEVRKHPEYFRTPILFLTAISDEGSFALSEFHCYNYITKPYTSQDILYQIEQMLITGYLQKSLEVVDTNRIHHRLKISEIYTIESKSHTLIISTSHGNIVTREYTLEKIAKLLYTDHVQCHRRILVNKAHITSYDKSSQYIQIGNQQVAVGRTYQKNIEALLTVKAPNNNTIL